MSVITSVLSGVGATIITAGFAALWRSFHSRFDKIEEHLRKQDLKIARIEGRLGD